MPSRVKPASDSEESMRSDVGRWSGRWVGEWRAELLLS